MNKHCYVELTQQNTSQLNASALNQDTKHWLSVDGFYSKKAQL